MARKQFYECGCCGCMHSIDFDGDCRDDAERFDIEQLDEIHGAYSWDEVEQPS